MSLPLQPKIRLALNATTFEDGLIQVSVRDAEGQFLDGYTTNACQLVHGDGTALPVCWGNRDDLANSTDGPICLRFELRKAEIYGFELIGVPGP